MNELIELPVKYGNTTQLFEIIEKYGKSLFSFVRGKVRTTEDAEDILQDVWFSFSKLEEPVGHLAGWLFNAARNRIVDGYRKSSPESLEDFAFEDEDGEINFKNILLADDSNRPEIMLLKNTFWTELNSALNSLPPEQKEVFVRNEIQGETFREISEETGVNIKTLISRKRYATEFLRGRLENIYNEFMNEWSNQ